MSSFYYRVDKINFNFTLSTHFRNKIIEDKASANALFYVQISLVNDLYSSMTVNIDLDSTFRRYCGVFSKVTTILDMIIIGLLILSSVTYIGSVIKTYRLAKVWELMGFCHHCMLAT